jgi:flagellar hook-basal body complex protein FliE
MPKKKKNEVAVGLTVLAVLVMTIYIVVTLADWSSLFTTQQELTVRLPYKTGLKGLGQGSPVHLGGVKIGCISDAGIFESEAKAEGRNDVFVFFTMKLPQQYQLRTDCLLAPQSNVLGGQVVLSIDDLGQDGELIRDGQVTDLKLASTLMNALKSEFDPNDPESLLGRVKSEFTKENENSVIAHLKNAVSKLDKSMSAISELLPQNLQKLDATLEAAHAAIEQMKTVVNDERIDKIMHNLTETSSNLKLATSKLDNTISVVSDLFQQELKKIDATLETAHAAIKHMKTVVKDERIDKIMHNLTETSSNLKLATQEIRRAPWKLLYKPGKKEFRIQALVDSAGTFASGAETLDSTSLRLRRLMDEMNVSQDVDKERIDAMLIELEDSFNQFQKAEKKFWEELE